MFVDYYEILNIDIDATKDDIKRAYRKRAREAHPDHHPDDTDFQTEEMSLINEAYDVLSNDRKRSSFDFEWRKHYRVKGMTQRRRSQSSAAAREYHHELTQPVTGVRDEPARSLPFWKNPWFIVLILVVLILSLTIGRGVVRQIALGYENTLGNRYRQQASERHLRAGQDLPRESLEDRLIQLRRAVELDPTNLFAGVALGRAQNENGEFESALVTARQGLENIGSKLANNPPERAEQHLVSMKTEFLMICYEAYTGQEMFEQAHNILLEILDINPDDDRTILNIALAELELGLTSNARSRLLELLGNSPDTPLLPAIESALARSYLISRNFREAMEVARSALENNPDDPQLHLILGEAAFYLGDHELAVEHLSLVSASLTDQMRIQLLLGKSYLFLGRPSEAVEHFISVIESDQNNFEAHMGLGNAYYGQRMFEEARGEYYIATQIQPDSEQAREAFERIP